MKIIGFDEVEGGIVLHCPSGKRKVCPISDDHDAVASALGALVAEILCDRKEPEADQVPALRDDYDDDDDDDDDDYEPAPRRRRSAPKKRRRRAGSAMGGARVDFKPRAGEDADGYVNRVGKEAGFGILRGVWRGLQRMSGTEVDE